MLKDEFVYIMYPVKIEKLKGLGLPFTEEKPVLLENVDEENFMPLWYGNAKFPEDE